MNKEQEIALAKFLLYLNDNYDRIKKYIDSDPRWIRNAAAEQGVEYTPQEIEDCTRIIKAGLEHIERQNEN